MPVSSVASHFSFGVTRVLVPIPIEFIQAPLGRAGGSMKAAALAGRAPADGGDGPPAVSPAGH
jgi:hypothetical protein